MVNDTVTMEDAVVIAMADLWPEINDHLDANHCILAARVAVEVGAYFGVPITARSTKVAVFNEVAVGWIGKPLADWPKEAWSVGAEGAGNHGPGYDGHVIAESEHWIIDLSAAQFNRPRHQIDVGDTIVVRKGDNASPERLLTIGLENGCQVAYMPLGDLDWQRAPDWEDRSNWTVEAGELIRRIKRAMRA